MGVSLDSKQRTEARAEANAAKLDTIRLYTRTELEPILGVTHRTVSYTHLDVDKRQVIEGAENIEAETLEAEREALKREAVALSLIHI